MTRQLKISRWQMTSRDQRIILYERAGRLAIAAARPAPRPNRPRVVSVAHCNLEGRSKLLVMAPPPRRLYTHIYGIAPYVSYVTKQLGLRVNTVAPPPCQVGFDIAVCGHLKVFLQFHYTPGALSWMALDIFGWSSISRVAVLKSPTNAPRYATQVRLTDCFRDIKVFGLEDRHV